MEYRCGILSDFNNDEVPEPVFEIVDSGGGIVPTVDICRDKRIVEAMESDARRGLAPSRRLRIATLAITLDIENTNLSPFVDWHMPWLNNGVHWNRRRIGRFVLDRKWWSGGIYNDTAKQRRWFEEGDVIDLVAPTGEHRPEGDWGGDGSIDLLILCTRRRDTWRRGLASIPLRVWWEAGPTRKTFVML